MALMRLVGRRKAMKTKMAVLLVLMCLLSAAVSGCLGNKTGGFESVESTEHLLGTIITIKVYVKDIEKGKKAVDMAFDRIRQIENLMSVNIPDSEVSRINEKSGIEAVKVSSDTMAVVKKGIYYGRLSGGLFDITIGPLVKLWGIGTDSSTVPGQQELQKAIALVDYRKVIIDDASDSIMLPVKGMMIDLGGIAKGYAADQVKELLIAEGIGHAVINLGGNVLTVGDRYDGNAWNIGIQDPYAPTGGTMGVARIKDMTVVSSGDYERYFEQDGKRYHHIINPRTGYPEQNNLKGVTVITGSSFDADALSTTLFLLGPEKGIELIEQLENAEAIMIGRDREVIVSSGLGDTFSIINAQYKMKQGD
jgi:thiamine biosynthesis lipoprotein